MQRQSGRLGPTFAFLLLLCNISWLVCGLSSRVRQADDVQPQLLYAGGHNTVPVVTSNSNYIKNVEQYKNAAALRLERGGDEADKEIAEQDKRNKELVAEELNKVNAEDKYKQTLVQYRKQEAEKLAQGFDQQLTAAKEAHEKQASEEDKKMSSYRKQWSKEIKAKRDKLVEADSKRSTFIMKEQQDKFDAERREKNKKNGTTDERRKKGKKLLKKRQKEDREKQEVRRKKLDEKKLKWKVRAEKEKIHNEAGEKKRREQVRRAKEKEEDLDEEQLEEKDKREAGVKKTQRQRIQEKAKENQIKERDEKNFHLTGMCSLAPQCSPGWSDRGLSGVILRNTDLIATQFAKGGVWGNGWTWIHPRLCCSDNPALDLNNQYVLGNQCPEGTFASGVGGVILAKKSYEANPFFQGGDLNPDWKWTHPFLCRTPSKTLLRRQGFTTCLFGRSCPAPWKDLGNTGLIMFNEHKGGQPFNQGGALNEQWTWIHPRLCCV